MRKLRNLLVIGLAVALVTLCLDWNWRVQSQTTCFPRDPRLPVPSWVYTAKGIYDQWKVQNRGIYKTQYGSIIGPYRWVKDADNDCPDLLPYLTNTNLEAHHLIEKRFADELGITDDDSMPAVLIPGQEHDYWTSRLQSKTEGLPVNRSYDLNQIWNLYSKVYASHPDWMDAVRAQWYRR
jgi:hypothetical protein